MTGRSGLVVLQERDQARMRSGLGGRVKQKGREEIDSRS